MDLDDLSIVLAVLDHDSLKSAAQATDRTRSALSRALGRLEKQLGVQLVERHARGITPTEAGRQLQLHGPGLLLDASNLRERLQSRPPAEVLRVMVFAGLPTPLVASPLVALLGPVRIEVDVSSDPLSHLDEGHDVYVHFGPAPDVGSYLSRVMIRPELRLLASPDYLARHGTPERPEDLDEHRLLAWNAPHVDPARWPLRNGGIVEVSPAFVSTDVFLLHCMAGRGAGVVLSPVGPFLEPPSVGTVVPVMEEVFGAPETLRILLRRPSDLTPGARDLIAVAGHFQDAG